MKSGSTKFTQQDFSLIVSHLTTAHQLQKNLA